MGYEIGEQVLSLKAVVWMKKAVSGMGLGVEALMRMLLGGVEVKEALPATGAPESHSTSKICCRMTRQHPFLLIPCPSW